MKGVSISGMASVINNENENRGVAKAASIIKHQQA